MPGLPVGARRAARAPRRPGAAAAGGLRLLLGAAWLRGALAGAGEGAVLRRLPLEELQAADALEELHLGDGRVLARCADAPPGGAAGCEHLSAERVAGLADCARLLALVDGDTLNFLGDVCQVQRCRPLEAPEYTTLYRGMEVYSLLCARVEYADAVATVYPDDVGKEHDYWTTSAAFKKDLRLFFRKSGREWTALELGAYRGYTTRVLSEVFRSVIAVEASDVFLGQNRRHNADRDNVLYVQLHTRVEGLRGLRHNRVQVVLVDAEHDYESVRRDVQGVLRFLGADLRFLVFDDYATDEGVRRAVDELVEEGRLRVVGGVGHRPPWAYHGVVVRAWEGVVCEVAAPPAPAAGGAQAAAGPRPGHVYVWLEGSLWYPDDSLDFRGGGLVASSRGPGRWRRDANLSQGVWLDWPAHKPPALGGPPGAEPGEETWFLQFNDDYDKFAAAFMGEPSRSAAGLAHEVLETMTRRLFVSVNHEFCNTANECELREARGAQAAR